jgi:hypothetical protein
VNIKQLDTAFQATKHSEVGNSVLQLKQHHILNEATSEGKKGSSQIGHSYSEDLRQQIVRPLASLQTSHPTVRCGTFP